MQPDQIAGCGRAAMNPHDIARRLGTILMVLGALVLGFVAYQLWGTGIEHASAQRELREEFEQLVAPTTTSPAPSTPTSEVGPKPTTTGPRTRVSLPTARPEPGTRDAGKTSVTVTTAVPRATSPRSTAPTTTPPPPTAPPTTAPPTTTPPPSTAPPSTVPPSTAPPVTLPPRPVYADGDAVFRLEIPRIGLDEIAVSGVGVEQLKQGPGHYPQTPLPGEPGNAAIAGHRTTYGAPFFDLDVLAPGDEVVATTYAGRFVYRVADTTIVAPTEIGVLAGTPDTRLTLTSCEPKYSAEKRIIVTALLDVDASTPTPTTPTPPPPETVLATTVPPAPSTVVAPTTVTTTPATSTTTASAATTTTTVRTTTTTAPDVRSRRPALLGDVIGPSDGPGAAPTVGPASDTPPPPLVSSLGSGWFDDGAAWLHVLLWGSACVAVIALATVLGRGRGSRILPWLVGAVPFTAGLYFFYENVNRLLPSGV